MSILTTIVGAVAVATAFYIIVTNAGRLLGPKADKLADAAVDAVEDLDRKFRAEWSDADDYVARAQNIWPALQTNPFFWGGVGTSLMICALGVAGSQALASGVAWLFVLYCLAFLGANLIQAAIAALGDSGRGDWYEFRKVDRPAWQWPALILLLLVNFVASITGSANVTAVLNTTSEIQAGDLDSKRRALKRAEADLEGLRTRRLNAAPGYSAEALQNKATETEAAAEREGNRGGCKSKCEALKEEAIKWRALADDAVRERKLGEKIAVMRADLGKMAEVGVKDIAAPHAQFMEDASGGVVSEKQVKTYLGPIFWLAFTVIDLALWLWAGDHAGRYRMKEYRRRAEEANAWLENMGLPARYTITSEGIVEDTKALPSPDGVPADSIHIDLSESVEARIEKSDRLRQVRSFFDSILIKAQGSKISIGKLHEVFSKIKQEQGERQYMNRADFASAVTTYCEITGMELLSNQIIGYKIGVTQQMEAAE